jgi:hypothetical protein
MERFLMIRRDTRRMETIATAAYSIGIAATAALKAPRVSA